MRVTLTSTTYGRLVMLAARIGSSSFLLVRVIFPPIFWGTFLRLYNTFFGDAPFFCRCGGTPIVLRIAASHFLMGYGRVHMGFFVFFLVRCFVTRVQVNGYKGVKGAYLFRHIRTIFNAFFVPNTQVFTTTSRRGQWYLVCIPMV